MSQEGPIRSRTLLPGPEVLTDTPITSRGRQPLGTARRQPRCSLLEFKPFCAIGAPSPPRSQAGKPRGLARYTQGTGCLPTHPAFARRGWAALKRPPLRAQDTEVPMPDESKPRWFLTCSCRWTRECSSRWAAESVAKLHPKLGDPGTEHTITIEESPDPDAPTTEVAIGPTFFPSRSKLPRPFFSIDPTCGIYRPDRAGTARAKGASHEPRGADSRR
jgi:hypothetical protein